MNLLKYFLVIAFLSGQALPQFPQQLMGRTDLAVKAELAYRGQYITDAAVPSNETMPFLLIGYAPLDFMAIVGGVGYHKFVVSEFNGREFQGGYGFSPQVGVSFTSPHVGPFRFTGGASLQYFSSEDPFGYRYYGSVVNPHLGVIYSPSTFVDIELGAKAHRIEGYIESPSTASETPTSDAYFSNSELFRGYVSLTLLTPLEGVFFHTSFDGSGQIGSDWEEGPPEAKFSLSLGMVLGWKARKKPSEKGPIYFPEMPELRRTAEEMEKSED